MSVNFEIASPLPLREGLLSADTFATPVFRRSNQPRRFQRIALAERINARLDGEKAILIDISLSGVLLAHENRREPGQNLQLQFDWHGESVAVECEVARVEMHRPALSTGMPPIYRSGLAFRHHQGNSEEVLRRMITELVERALDERRANARGIPPIAASYMRTGRVRGYLQLHYVHGVWQKFETGDPIQPKDGFTVAVNEDAIQVKLLCQTYEKLSEHDRDLVRRMAALTIANPEGTPARRYDP